MENAIDALIMAGQVLMFIAALSVCMSSFSTLRIEIDEVLGHTDTIRFAKDDNEQYKNFIESKNAKSNRIVGVETIVASMYRAVKEDYIIYIIFKNEINETDKDKWGLAYAKINDVEEKNMIEITIGIKEDGISENVDQILNKGFYDFIKEREFNEYLGEYQNASAPGVTTENKLTKRIITYEEQ